MLYSLFFSSYRGPSCLTINSMMMTMKKMMIWCHTARKLDVRFKMKFSKCCSTLDEMRYVV